MIFTQIIAILIINRRSFYFYKPAKRTLLDDDESLVDMIERELAENDNDMTWEGVEDVEQVEEGREFEEDVDENLESDDGDLDLMKKIRTLADLIEEE